MNVVDLAPHDLAVVAAIEAVDRPVGFARAPEGALEALTSTADGPDYVIVYPISGRRVPSSVNDSVGDADLVYQTTVVARLPEGARWLISRIEEALYAIAIPGRAVVRVVPDEIGAVRPDENLRMADGSGPVFIATPLWRIWTSAARS